MVHDYGSPTSGRRLRLFRAFPFRGKVFALPPPIRPASMRTLGGAVGSGASWGPQSQIGCCHLSTELSRYRFRKHSFRCDLAVAPNDRLLLTANQLSPHLEHVCASVAAGFHAPHAARDRDCGDEPMLSLRGNRCSSENVGGTAKAGLMTLPQHTRDVDYRGGQSGGAATVLKGKPKRELNLPRIFRRKDLPKRQGLVRQRVGQIEIRAIEHVE